MSQVGVQGQYSAEGANPTFIVSRSDGVIIENHGRLTRSSISYLDGDLTLLFRRNE